jgi:ABC-type Fe3+/spermidine/putrescine transport system ATPase subunit
VDYDLQLINIGKVYDNGTPAVMAVNLDIKRGEFVALLGPSGCGKTTTLRMIAGFESVTSGDLLIGGSRVNDLPAERRPTSMIFQNYALFPHMTVRRNVGYGLEVKKLAKRERDAKVDSILEKFGLLDIAEQPTHRLSGGQRQRIALARGLVVEPQILLLDEPLGALDANLRKTIQAELKLLQRSLGITFVFVTHAQSEALTMSDRVVVMNQGRIEQNATPYQLYTRPATSFVAQFIGRNTIFAGTLTVSNDAVSHVDTEFGHFSGLSETALRPHSAVRLVVPSEAFDVVPDEGAGRADSLKNEYGGNVLAGVVQQYQVVGHLVQLTVNLAGAGRVELEGYISQYGHERFKPSSAVLMCWKPEEATVIAC